jgi:hypothetical protein
MQLRVAVKDGQAGVLENEIDLNSLTARHIHGIFHDASGSIRRKLERNRRTEQCSLASRRAAEARLPAASLRDL